MRKLQEMLRLRFEHQLSNRAIARSIGISPSTVSDLFGRFVASGLSWPLPLDLEEVLPGHRPFLPAGTEASGPPLPARPPRRLAPTGRHSRQPGAGVGWTSTRGRLPATPVTRQGPPGLTAGPARRAGCCHPRPGSALPAGSRPDRVRRDGVEPGRERHPGQRKRRASVPQRMTAPVCLQKGVARRLAPGRGGGTRTRSGRGPMEIWQLRKVECPWPHTCT